MHQSSTELYRELIPLFLKHLLYSCLADSSSVHSFAVAARVMEGEEIQLYIHAHATAEQRPYAENVKEQDLHVMLCSFWQSK